MTTERRGKASRGSEHTVSGPDLSSEPVLTQRKVVVVDDDKGLLRLMGKALEREGWAARGCDSGSDALASLLRESADLMLLDLKLQDMDGAAVIEELQSAGKCPPFVIITGQGDERVAVEMMKRGALDYLVKDVDFLEFVPTVVRRALEQVDRENRLAQAEQELRLIRSVVHRGFSAVLIVDADLPDPRVVYINPAFGQATGWVAEQVTGQRLSRLAGLEHVREKLAAGFPDAETFVEHVESYAAQQGERWGEWRLGPVKDTGGRVTHWLVIFRDITERKRLEKDVLEISDRERIRIGQDLHDGLSQHLAGIELMTEVLEQKLAGRHKSAAARVADIGRHVREAITQARALARGLSPVTLELEGLGSALEELAHNAENLFGIRCTYHSSFPSRVKNPGVAIHLYRIAQEAVSNAVKHGRAKEVRIEASLESDLVLRIQDNGTGFPDPLPRGGGMGLRIMHYRAGMIGGTLSLENRPEGGGCVVCRIPSHEIAR